MRGCDIVIDDGVATSIRSKGDGVQSLAALALMRYASEKRSSGKNQVIAIEEPESHLHPAAIQELRQVVDELSNNNQVIITTHNPLFVNRQSIIDNIIVKENQANPASNIEEIRDTLGVRVSDNLRSAYIVLIVEGIDDSESIVKILSSISQRLRDALCNNFIAVEYLAGASNLIYKIQTIRNAACDIHCLLDDDKAGRLAYESAKKSQIINDSEITFTKILGRKESELEDLYSLASYAGEVLKYFGVDLVKYGSILDGKSKWSEKIGRIFGHAGKNWDENVKSHVKNVVSRAVSGNPEGALDSRYTSVIESLKESLERKLLIAR